MSVRAVFLWHLHQPEYRDPQTGQPMLPWVRQHASRAYTDMAAALERHPTVKVVANWAPSLLDQLEAYVAGTQDLDEQLARKPAEALTPEERAHVLREGFSVDWNVWVRPVARYSELLDKRGTDLREIDLLERQAAFTPQEMRDLQVNFVLAWMGFAARREEPLVAGLIAKERGYTEEEKVAAVDAQRRIASRIVPAPAVRLSSPLRPSTTPSCRWSWTPSRPGARCRRWRCRRASRMRMTRASR